MSLVSRRTILRATAGGIAGLGAASLLAGCGGSGGGSGGGGKATVRMWTWYTQQQEIFPQLISEFEAAHPNITVENRMFGDTNAYLPALQAAVAGGDPPEIFAPHVLALQYGNAGISADLGKDLGPDFTADFFESANQEYTDNGKQYALGWMAQTFGIFYNPALLQQAGVTEPETWDDLLAASLAVKERTGKIGTVFANNPGTNGLDLFLPMLTQLTDDPTFMLRLDKLDGVTWEHPVVVEGLGVLDELVRGGAFQEGINATQTNQAEQLLYTGEAAMLFMGSWVPQDFVKSAPPEFLQTYKVMETPAMTPGGKHWCANQAGAGLAVSETSPNKEAALEFIRFLYDTERYAKAMNDSNSMPSTKSAAEQVSDPVLQQMTSWLLEGNGCPHILFGPGSAAAADPLAALIDGSMTPAETASAMQAAVESAGG
ncbi:ABC transporter substrate-binding protein [Pseudonocardia nigra]|uniref:ABC transporter substrate-binding protein n=1 Tax=Pseudonocardia nigra TaxID=1921578 RepID=UPI001C5EEE33|nr:extracellular solute-binding protein [Pseudonocardia nigra]